MSFFQRYRAISNRLARVVIPAAFVSAVLLTILSASGILVLRGPTRALLLADVSGVVSMYCWWKGYCANKNSN